MQKGRAAQSGCAVSTPVFVDEQRECDSALFAKQSRIVRVTQTNGGEARSFILGFLFVRAQLRDVLPAKNSAVVTEEHDHGWTALPERAEAKLTTLRIGEHNVGEIASVRHELGKLSSFRARLSERQPGLPSLCQLRGHSIPYSFPWPLVTAHVSLAALKP